MIERDLSIQISIESVKIISIFIDCTFDSIIICNMKNDNKSHSIRLRIENRSTSVDYVFDYMYFYFINTAKTLLECALR